MIKFVKTLCILSILFQLSSSDTSQELERIPGCYCCLTLVKVSGQKRLHLKGGLGAAFEPGHSQAFGGFPGCVAAVLLASQRYCGQTRLLCSHIWISAIFLLWVPTEWLFGGVCEHVEWTCLADSKSAFVSWPAARSSRYPTIRCVRGVSTRCHIVAGITSWQVFDQNLFFKTIIHPEPTSSFLRSEN